MTTISPAEAVRRARALTQSHPLLTEDVNPFADAFRAMLPADEQGDYDEISVMAVNGACLHLATVGSESLSIRGEDAGVNFLDPQAMGVGQATSDLQTATDTRPVNDEAFMVLVASLGTQMTQGGTETVTGLPLDRWVDEWIPAWAENHQV